MEQKLATFLETTGITFLPIGIYDVLDTAPFEPYTGEAKCVFALFDEWQNKKSTIIDPEKKGLIECPGAGFYFYGIAEQPPSETAHYLAGVEGLKQSPKIMTDWMESVPSYAPGNQSVVLSHFKGDQYEYLKTLTFFVRPDQLSLLLTGAEYLSASMVESPVKSPYGAGCGLMLTMFKDLQKPEAIIGATDIAMRKYLPADILAFSVTKPMLEQLLDLDENSFLHKTFWSDLKNTRKNQL